MCLYVYICLYRYVLFTLVCTCSYLHIFTYSFGSLEGTLDCVLYFEVPYHCIVIYISVFLYRERNTCANLMKNIYIIPKILNTWQT